MKFFPATRSEFAIWPWAPDIDPARLVCTVWRSWMRRLAIRHVRRELSSMPDWLLCDVGIKRTDIHSLAVELVDSHHRARFAPEQRR
jgi:uncharacterized protein YjiS (DUF1127 family)